MKIAKTILALLALLPFSRAFAQVGEIIYRDFEPDSILIYWLKLGPMYIDLDEDNVSDINMYMVKSGKMCVPFIKTTENPKVQICIIHPDSTDFILGNVAEESWKDFLHWSLVYKNYHYGFRIQHEDGYLYGWFETFSWHSKEKDDIRIAYYGFDRTADCTIPNYPLRWGQTEFVDVEEFEDKSSGKFQPNPTTGLVTITGENATEVQVFNPLGQLVKTVQNTNEVSLEGLPPGVYLLRVATKEGLVFSDKVVKE